jgi:ADP-ribose pyrophosphatase YjhB (NUDIX family)
MSRVTVDKVVGYVTQGDRLLVFGHPNSPSAGIQVPAGTVETGESLNDAVIHEVREETGLSNVSILSFLGAREYDMSPFGKAEVHRRHFYQVLFLGEAPSTCVHYETSGGRSEPIAFEFFWAELPDRVPELIAGQGELLSSLPISPR